MRAVFARGTHIRPYAEVGRSPFEVRMNSDG
jgi:hypothetical protein